MNHPVVCLASVHGVTTLSFSLQQQQTKEEGIIVLLVRQTVLFDGLAAICEVGCSQVNTHGLNPWGSPGIDFETKTVNSLHK